MPVLGKPLCMSGTPIRNITSPNNTTSRSCLNPNGLGHNFVEVDALNGDANGNRQLVVVTEEVHIQLAQTANGKWQRPVLHLLTVVSRELPKIAYQTQMSFVAEHTLF